MQYKIDTRTHRKHIVRFQYKGNIDRNRKMIGNTVKN